MQRRAVALAASLLAACGGKSSGPHDWPASLAPTSEVPEPGVRREVVQVAGAPADPNPNTGGKADASADVTIVHRYRADAATAVEVRAVIIAVPGFLAGARAFDLLARALVRRGTQANQPVEVWAIDRRANLLEDRRGFTAAALAGNPEIAQGYYFGADTIGGAKFAGFLPQTQLDYLSEWGLALHVEDLHRVVQLVPQAQRKAHVFLMGHSLGGMFAEAYSAWRFADGTRGFDELAGVLLLDGTLAASPVDQLTYQNGTTGTLGPSPGLNDIRSTTRYSSLPVLGVSTYAHSEIVAQRAVVAPAAVVADADRDTALGFILGLDKVPRMTNKAAVGFGFDRQFNGIGFLAASLGAPTGGPSVSYTNALVQKTLLHPSDVNATYDWDDSATATPAPYTQLDAFARAYSSASGNFVEWYFPARLPLDLGAVGGGTIAESSWQAQAGLRAFDGIRNDAPVLAMAAYLVSLSQAGAVASRIASAVGPGRPNAGAPRTSDAGLQVVDATALSHVDVLTGTESARNPVHGAIEVFVRANATAGTIPPPAF
jgi:hypothetical protein